MKRDIAIIGMSGRFPKSNSIKELWKNLVDEKELIHFFSDKELVEKGIVNPIIMGLFVHNHFYWVRKVVTIFSLKKDKQAICLFVFNHIFVLGCF